MNVEEFNNLYPIGTPVIYTDDFGGKHQTITRSPAWDLCGTPVVKLDGKTGGYDIERINPIDTNRERQTT